MIFDINYNTKKKGGGDLDRLASDPDRRQSADSPERPVKSRSASRHGVVAAAKELRRWWCRLAHREDNLTRPVQGLYRCLDCGEEYRSPYA
jgi:hypothetical protein